MLKDNLSKYWAVKVDSSISSDKMIYLFADYVEIDTKGNILFMKQEKQALEDYCIFAIPHGKWFLYFAASQIDGNACCVEHWEQVKQNKKKKDGKI